MINNTEKRPFDPTVSFTFFGTWVKTIEGVKKQLGDSAAYALYSAIAEYSMYTTEPKFTEFPLLQIVWPTIEREIDLSIGNRKRGFAKDALNDNYQVILQAIIDNPNASLRAIGEKTGTNKDMVERVKKKYRAEIEAAIAAKDCHIDSCLDSPNDGDCHAVSVDDSVPACDPINAIDGDSANDSMRHDNARQMRQENHSAVDPLICSLSSWIDLPEEVKQQFTISDRIRARIMRGDCVLIDNTSHNAVRSKDGWNQLYTAWRQSIETEASNAILEIYLSTHTESPTQKRIGDKYGRIITGWDADRQEPTIAYSLSYLDKATRHSLSDVPEWYYREGEQVISIEEEREAIIEAYAEDIAAETGMTMGEALETARHKCEIDDDGLPF